MRGLLLLLALALPATAGAEVGLGASLRDSDVTLYLPIDSTATARVEPFFAYSDQDLSGPVDISSTTLSLGVGLFRKLEIRDKAQVYLGARLGYSKFKVRSSDPGVPDQDAEGFLLEPTLGIEYRFADQVAVALEALVYYRTSSEDFAGADFDSDTIGTANRILLRVYFPS